jgi:hypothetical protein
MRRLEMNIMKTIRLQDFTEFGGETIKSIFVQNGKIYIATQEAVHIIVEDSVEYNEGGNIFTEFEPLPEPPEPSEMISGK